MPTRVLNMSGEADVTRSHYRSAGLRAKVDAILDQALPAEQLLLSTDLAGLDQFHVGGLPATEELSSLCQLQRDSIVLDVGSGLGGPARHLAHRFGCLVEGIDLSHDYVELATALNKRGGLTDRVRFRLGDACHLPFRDRTFDVVWTQHAAMNIANRPALYSEVARVLKPSGLFAVYDPVATAVGSPDFPLPWARTPSTSFLVTAEEMRSLLTTSGLFKVESWKDKTTEAATWLAERLNKTSQAVTAERRALAALSLGMVMGPDFSLMMRNFARSLTDRRLSVIQAVLRRSMS
jgi:ubiquinone/menaquinone biosynthesis C-methylase UbiE